MLIFNMKLKNMSFFKKTLKKHYEIDEFGEFNPHLSFHNLLKYHHLNDYEAVRPLYGMAIRIFEYGVFQAKQNNNQFKKKLETYESMLTVECSAKHDTYQSRQCDIFEWTTCRGNELPYWIRVEIESYIQPWVEQINKAMESFKRPLFWNLIRGHFGENAKLSHLKEYTEQLKSNVNSHDRNRR